MTAHLEMWGPAGVSMIPLGGDRITLGSSDSNDVAVPADRIMSRLHAVFEHYPAGWCVRDLGSRNGTFVNGRRIWQEHALADGDEIRAGASRFVLRSGRVPAGQVTEAGAAPPELTGRERDVLVQLCRRCWTARCSPSPRPAARSPPRSSSPRPRSSSTCCACTRSSASPARGETARTPGQRGDGPQRDHPHRPRLNRGRRSSGATRAPGATLGGRCPSPEATRPLSWPSPVGGCQVRRS
ncbi:FHA domain-containing protein [Catellatospora coxensis]